MEDTRDGQVNGFSRRQALRVVGSTASVVPFVGRATAENSEQRYVGVSYSPATHKEQGEVFGSLNFRDGSVKGRLEIGGFNIPIGQDGREKPVEDDGLRRTYIIVKDQPAFVRDGKPLVVKLIRIPGRVYGYLSRSETYGKLAFLMGPKADYRPRDARNALPNKGAGRDNAPPEQMPDRGIPKRVPLHKQAEHWEKVTTSRNGNGGAK